MKARHYRIQLGDPNAATVTWDELYRITPWPKPRAARRRRRRRAARRARMTPEARALEDFIVANLLAGLRAAEDAQILYGDGTAGSNLTGLL